MALLFEGVIFKQGLKPETILTMRPSLCEAPQGFFGPAPVLGRIGEKEVNNQKKPWV